MPRRIDAVITPNEIFQGVRRQLHSPVRRGQCISRGELADVVNRALDLLYPRRNLQSQYVDARWVGKLERGEVRWPSAERRAALREVFGVTRDQDLDLYSPRRTEAVIPASIGVPPTAVHDWDQLLHDFRIEWRLLVENDQIFGPEYALSGVGRQIAVLDALATQTPPEFRLPLQQVRALYAESAAWLYHSLDDDVSAERWTERSLDLAREAGDGTMLAWAHYRSSQHQLSRRLLVKAAGQANDAAAHDTALPGPMRAAIRVQKAHTLAAMGGYGAAMRLMDEAHRWAADRSSGMSEGEHGAYCTSGYIEVYRGACLLLAQQPAKAVAAINHALPRISHLQRQDYATALLHKATAEAVNQEPEAAATTACAALSTARRAGSKRLLRSLHVLGSRLEPLRGLAEVAAYLEDLAGSADGVRV